MLTNIKTLLIDDGCRQRLLKNPEVVLREGSDDWALLYNPDNVGVAGIDPVGVAIWKMLDGKSSAFEIAEALKASFYDIWHAWACSGRLAYSYGPE